MNWNYEYTEGNTEAFILRDDGAVIARLETEAGTNAHEILWERTSLFSAAPELIAVAQMVLASQTVETPQYLVDAANAAIEKAEGLYER